MKTPTISTQEGFLRQLRRGESIQAMYRAQRLVSVVTKVEQLPSLIDDSGSFSFKELHC